MQEFHNWAEGLEHWAKEFAGLQLLYGAAERPGMIIFSKEGNLFVIACSTNELGFPVLLFRAEFDIMDSAVFEYLPRQNFVVRRIQNTPSYIRYELQDDIIGELIGAVILRRLTAQLTELRFDTSLLSPRNVVSPHYCFQEFLLNIFHERARVHQLESSSRISSFHQTQQVKLVEKASTLSLEERDHHQELLYIKKRRLKALEIQAARYGTDCPAHLSVEIQDLRKDIAGLEDLL